MKTKVKKTYNYLISLLIIIATYGFLYFQIFEKKKLDELWNNFKQLTEQNNFVPGLSLVFIIMLINWAVETVKWKLLISRIEKVSFLKAYQAVLTGVSVSAFLPNRVGEYFGRVFILKKANHIEGILLTIVGSMSQIMATMLYGSIALLIFIPAYIEDDNYLNYLYYGILAVLILGNFLIFLFYFNISVLSHLLKRITPKNWTKLSKHLDAFNMCSKKELVIVLLYSLLRYLIFSSQFYILLLLFKLEIPFFQAMILIWVVYFILTAIPTVALSELGVRGSISVLIIGMYFTGSGNTGINTDLAILSASSALWFINIVIPAITGTFFVFNLKFFRKNNK